MRNLLPSLRLVFQERRFLLIPLSLTLLPFALSLPLLLFALFLSIPVWTTPGNSFLFQMGIYTLYDFLLFGLLAGLSALVLTLSLSYARTSFSLFGYAAVGTSTGTFAALFGSATCASCLATVLGFLGAGTVFTLLAYRWYVVAGLGLLLLLSLYLVTAKTNTCRRCT